MDKFTNISTNMVQYVKDGNDSEFSEAFASPSLNPGVRWTRFILTDDKPNGNGHIVPIEEFNNLIKTGRFMPLKMAEGKINEDHSDAKPIGVITHLQKIKNKIIGLAALWSNERQEDVDFLKARYDNKEPIDLSWEIGYANSETNEEDGTIKLLDTYLKAATIVGIPAYNGRTIVTAIASEDDEEDSKLDKEKFDEIKSSLTLAEDKIGSLSDELKTKTEEASTLFKEVEELREYKQEIEDAKERLTKVASIKEKFVDAGIEKEDKYFDENIDKLLNMKEEDLDFMIQELVAFSSQINDDEDDKDDVDASLPRLSKDTDNVDVKTLVKYLKDKNKKE
jgi:hypothetical protein